jgi:hypothetical protein
MLPCSISHRKRHPHKRSALKLRRRSLGTVVEVEILYSSLSGIIASLSRIEELSRSRDDMIVKEDEG